MNLCIFNMERHGSMWNEDYEPNRLIHVRNVIESILQTNYFNYFAIIISDPESTDLISPTKKRTIVNEIEKLKPTDSKSHFLRALRKNLFVSQMRHWDSVHVVSFISTEQSLSDVVLRRNELIQLKNFHINFILFGDIVSPVSHTRNVVFSMVKRQGRTWKVTEVEPYKVNPYKRLMLRLSEGIIFPKKKAKQALPSMKTGQLPSEHKANKYISCKILNYPTKDGVQLIPIPIVAKERIVSVVRCGKCTIEKGKCVSNPNTGKLYLIEVSPILFKLIFKNDAVIENINIYNKEIEHKIVTVNNREFLILEGLSGLEKRKKFIYWMIDQAEPFVAKIQESIDKEPTSNYMKVMETIWLEHQKTLNKMEEKYMVVKKEKDPQTPQHPNTSVNVNTNIPTNTQDKVKEITEKMTEKMTENTNEKDQSKENELILTVEKNEKDDH